MGSTSRVKGVRAEQAVVLALRKWWRRHDPKADFMRVPLSGGWATADARTAYRAVGDIMTTSASWPFAVEVKRREQAALENLLALRGCPVWQWWAQTLVEADELSAEPLLLFRQNREQWKALLRAKFVEAKLPCVVFVDPQRERFREPPALLMATDLFLTDPQIWARKAKGGS